MTLQEVADTVGVSRQRVKQILDKHGGDLPVAERYPRTCKECGVLMAVSTARHRREEHGSLGGSLMTPEREMKHQFIVDSYLSGTRLFDISRTIRSERTGQPLTFSSIYRILRRNGIEPSRGGGRYERTPEIVAKQTEGRRLRRAGYGLPKESAHGWRASDK